MTCAAYGLNPNIPNAALNATGSSNQAATAASVANLNVLVAPWDPANGSNEAVGVYSFLNSSSVEWQVWDGLLTRLDALIDKDFTYTSLAASQLSIDHVFLGWDGTLANADYFDFDPSNQIFDVGMNVDAISLAAQYQGLSYQSYYSFIAAHELGHTLGLKHPFDDFGVNNPADNSLTTADTAMAYGVGDDFTSLDIAALIAVNGIEDDLVNGETPVHRFYNTNNGGHFFTASASEAEFVATQLYDVFNYEGTGFYADPSATAANSEAIYRFYNSQTGGHFFTASEGERDFVQQQLSGQYQYEGVGFYASATDTSSADAVYRFYNQGTGGHFFTGSQGERDFVLASLGDQFTYEGIGFYA